MEGLWMHNMACAESSGPEGDRLLAKKAGG